MTMDITFARPCPHCESRLVAACIDIRDKDEPEGVYVACTICCIEGPTAKTETLAIQGWNALERRAETSAPQTPPPTAPDTGDPSLDGALPCPKCGGRNLGSFVTFSGERGLLDPNIIAIKCTCGCEGPLRAGYAEAIAAWNALERPER